MIRAWDTSKTEEFLERTTAEITALGEEPAAEVLDVRDADAFTAFFEKGIERFGRIDTLVNVAGGTFVADFLDTNVRGWDAVIRMNFGWLLHSTHLAATRMKAQGD